MKLNNKGFAITAVLYGLLILFVLFVSFYLVILSVKKDRFEIIVNDIEDDYRGIKITDYITNLYLNSDKTSVKNNGIIYNYAPLVNLMNDRLGGKTEDYNTGNIRYYGSNPKNYIDVGDRDSSGRVILYRIIGVFKDVELEDGTKNDLVKVIRADSIGDFSWDNKTNGIGTSKSNNGSNNWIDARIMKLLNPGYVTETVGGSLYYNSSSGNCYSGTSNATIACDFTSTGLSESAKGKIETVVWNLGGYNGNSQFANNVYEKERGGIEGSNNPKWSGEIALMYPGDYAYAVDFNNCEVDMNKYDDYEDCYKNDWLYLEKIQWTLSPWYNYSDRVRRIVSSDSPETDDTLFQVYNKYSVRPVFYLKYDNIVKSGNGTYTNPYEILYLEG